MLTVLTVLTVLFKFSTSGSAALLFGERKTFASCLEVPFQKKQLEK